MLGNKKILLTGSHGFIGSHIKERLEKDNEIKTVSHEILGAHSFPAENIIKDFLPHIIIHASSYGNHAMQQDVYGIWKANVENTFWLLNYIATNRHIPLEAFIHFGTSSEYGKKKFPMKEDFNLEPLTIYAATKAAGTMLARGFAKEYHLPIVTIRPFSVYGPGEGEHRFIPTIIRSSLRSEKVLLDPSGVHDWIYIDDFINGLIKVIENVRILQGNAVNIGTGIQWTNQQIIQQLAVIMQHPIKTEITGNIRPNDSNPWIADISLLHSLGWQSEISLIEGLGKTYLYYKRLYEAH